MPRRPFCGYKNMSFWNRLKKKECRIYSIKQREYNCQTQLKEYVQHQRTVAYLNSEAAPKSSPWNKGENTKVSKREPEKSDVRKVMKPFALLGKHTQ